MDKGQIELLDSLLDMIAALEFGDDSSLDHLKTRGEMIIRRICGDDSDYISDFVDIYFYPLYPDPSKQDKLDTWNLSKDQSSNIINTIKEEILLFADEDGEPAESTDTGPMSDKIFVVHGHDEELKLSVTLTLEKLDLNPIILHEMPNKGRTIIEKFTDYSDVGFAVVLLSPDDIAHTVNADDESYRARQNVVLELGFFLGKLGRPRVATIHREHKNFKMPSDYDGVIFTPYDAKGAWKFELANELKAAGYDIDVNKLLPK